MKIFLKHFLLKKTFKFQQPIFCSANVYVGFFFIVFFFYKVPKKLQREEQYVGEKNANKHKNKISYIFIEICVIIKKG